MYCPVSARTQADINRLGSEILTHDQWIITNKMAGTQSVKGVLWKKGKGGLVVALMERDILQELLHPLMLCKCTFDLLSQSPCLRVPRF